MKTITKFIGAVCALLAMSVSPVQAKIVLPDIIGDDMVLQQKTQAHLWGQATPKCDIT